MLIICWLEFITLQGQSSKSWKFIRWHAFHVCSKNPSHMLTFYRDELDQLHANQFVWELRWLSATCLIEWRGNLACDIPSHNLVTHTAQCGHARIRIPFGLVPISYIGYCLVGDKYVSPRNRNPEYRIYRRGRPIYDMVSLHNAIDSSPIPVTGSQPHTIHSLHSYTIREDLYNYFR